MFLQKLNSFNDFYNKNVYKNVLYSQYVYSS